MLYKLIEKKRNEWLNSNECTVSELLKYIEQRGMMRDAQLEAIKTYLFLKIACQNQPLWKLFVDGRFNDTNIGQLELTETARQVFSTTPAAVALFQYARLKDKNGKQLAPELEKYIKQHADEIDYEEIFKKLFYDVTYTDYLFSLPMGAGKTYLMAALIYLDLYFAQNEPNNPAFAHNFMVMAPSGLKSSIVPSLKHIKEFDPSWIIPEPTASQLKRLIKFEILDEQKSANKSNRIKNPNAQKINNHQPLEDLIGLVAISNAEKVILDRMDTDKEPSMYSEDELKRLELANELRELIGNLPNLAIYIDEVHHAADGEIKLRQVVTGWTAKHTFNSVLGFSGTPYLESAERVTIAEGFSIKNTDLSNVVYYYPLIEGIGNFLKTPEVKYADNDTLTIVKSGVREFFDKYKDTVYADGTCAKLAIYCGQIETLEETIHPLVAEIVTSYGLNPTEAILKYHGGNKQYPQPEGAETAFASLDLSFSKVRVVLLVQIGKEGWDCKSLTGVILPQKGVCPTNMVLQTTCRCLRQVVKHSKETAIVWLNKFNADTLNKQLQQQQNITLQEFSSKPVSNRPTIERFSRMEHVQVPPIDFYQLKVSYETLVIDEANDPHTRLQDESLLVETPDRLVHQQDMTGKLISVYAQENDETQKPTFEWWLQQIAKESFSTITVRQLKTCEAELRAIYDKLTPKHDDYTVTEEVVPEHAALLQIGRTLSPMEDNGRFYPSQKDVHDIIEWDEKPAQEEVSPEVQKLIDQLSALGQDVSALKPQTDPHPERTQTYHYLPYRFDSNLEVDYFSTEVLPLIHGKALELYFNGDDTLTEFKINCYKRNGTRWNYIGKYVPDFLLLSRNEANEIDKVIIIETKGEGFAPAFADKKAFMETEFIRKNNEKFGYKRFDFLYLEDTLTAEQRRQKTVEAIHQFFNM